ncbi:hypothetical protein SESBI_14314 [Sesbania bispinosa]|nr:hypothetical protein SESBI_14314 [Sesbania bispinosa]
MPPKTMDEVAMLKALRAREKKAKVNEQKAFASVECTGVKQADAEAGSSSLQRKKQKINDEGLQTALNSKTLIASTAQTLTNKQTDTNPVLTNADKWWCLFNDFEGHMEKELKSLSLKNKELTEKLKLAEADMKTVGRLKTDLVSCEKRNNELIAEKATWDEKYSKMEKAYQDAETGKKALEEANKI